MQQRRLMWRGWVVLSPGPHKAPERAPLLVVSLVRWKALARAKVAWVNAFPARLVVLFLVPVLGVLLAVWLLLSLTGRGLHTAPYAVVHQKPSGAWLLQCLSTRRRLTYSPPGKRVILCPASR